MPKSTRAVTTMNKLSFKLLKGYINILGYIAPELAAKKAQNFFYSKKTRTKVMGISSAS